MRRTLTIPAALLLAALTLTGCSAGSNESATDYSDGSAGGGVSAPALSEGGDAVTDSEGATVDRQVIVTGWVTVTVDEPSEAATEAIRIAESIGGRVDSRSEYAPIDGDKGSATLTLRLPAESLTATIDKLTALGEVQEISLNTDDVTMVTQDLDARIAALSASVDRLLALLATAKDTDTLIQLETAISDRQAQLESLQSERRYYADQVSLSTITLNLVSVADAPVKQPDTFVTGIVAGWNAFVAFFQGLLVVLGVLLPWIVLAGLITALVVWLIKRRQAKTETPTD